MLSISLRLRKRKVAAAFIALLCVCSAAIGAKVVISQNQAVPTENLQTLEVKKCKVKSNEDRINFLQQYGWIVDEEPVEVMEVLIPDDFDDVYNQYNAIQKEQGLNLEKYGGKKVKRFTYNVTNYPDCPDNVHANLLIYKDTLIGVDICSTEVDGFMHGLIIPTEKSYKKTPILIICHGIYLLK